MKKAIIKFFIWLIILVAISGTVFYFGWLQLAMPAGSYGVMLSKSGGYHNEPIIPGEFSWRWERIIPTNAKILVFNLSPQNIEYSTEGVLPSSEKFSIVSEKNYNFKWKWGIDVSATLNPAKLISVVKSANIKSQSDLDSFIENKVIESAQICANEFIDYFLNNPDEYEKAKFHYGELQKKITKNLKKLLGDEIVIHSVELASDFIMPDLKLYNSIRDAYIAYEKEQRDALITLSKERGKKEAIQKFRMDYLKEWGEILKQYPQLVDFLAVARNDASETLDALRALKFSSKKTKSEESSEN